MEGGREDNEGEESIPPIRRRVLGLQFGRL